MDWQFISDRPIYAQFVEQISLRIVSGLYEAGGKLPSVREFAEEAKVNPNTIQRAFAELERLGLVYSQRTAGRFITEDKQMIENTKNTLAEEQVRAFIEKMKELGFKKEQIIPLITKNMEEGDVNE